jgi:hypothetical protein
MYYLTGITDSHGKSYFLNLNGSPLKNFLDWISFLAYPNLFGIKDFVVVVIEWQSFKKLWKGILETT